jgi:hypothetical protein
MPLVAFEELPDESRLWVFGIDRALGQQEQKMFLQAVDQFLETWVSHGAPLRSGRDWRRSHFLLIAVDDSSMPPSGCSIDAMIRVLKVQEDALGVEILDNSPVWFLDEGEIRRLSRKDFGNLARNGVVGPDTVVFDNTVTCLKEERSGCWERPAGESWHRRAFLGHLA